MASIRTAVGSLPGYYGMHRLERQRSIDPDGPVSSFRLLLIAFFLPSICMTTDVIPPVIIEGPAANMIYPPDPPYRPIILPCIANGTPPLTYEWFRDGERLNPEPNSKIRLESDGNLSLHHPVAEGFYQCRVANRAGVAVSNITHLQPAVFEERRLLKEDIVKDAFQPLLRPCNHIKRSVPEAVMSWHYGDSEDSRIVSNDRVIVTDNGSLIFTSLLPSDSCAYKCFATNSVTGRGIGGSYFHLKVNEVSSEGQHGPLPRFIYSSDETVRVLEGNPFSLWCIFSGVNLSGASWLLPTRTTLPRPTWRLNFSEAKSSDDGNYSCFVEVGSGNTKIKMEKVIRVIVDARPQLEEHLQGQKVQRGDSALFTCRSTGRPPPTVSWLINGTLYNSTAYNSTCYNGFLDHKGTVVSCSLLLRDVQSSASIACNVSNKYGHQLSTNYLIVGDSVARTSSSSPTQSTLTSTIKKFSSTTGSNKESAKDSNSTVSPDNGGSDQKKQDDSVGSAFGEYSIPIMVTAAIVVVLIGLAIAVIFVLRRRKKNRKYSLKVQDAAVSLKSGENRGHDGKTWACDSDDSGYDDVGRKPKKPLTGPAVMISRL